MQKLPAASGIGRGRERCIRRAQNGRQPAPTAIASAASQASEYAILAESHPASPSWSSPRQQGFQRASTVARCGSPCRASVDLLSSSTRMNGATVSGHRATGPEFPSAAPTVRSSRVAPEEGEPDRSTGPPPDGRGRPVVRPKGASVGRRSDGLRCRAVEAVLRRFQAVRDQRAHGLRGVAHEQRQVGPIPGGDRLEHELGGLLAAGRTADPHADPGGSRGNAARGPATGCRCDRSCRPRASPGSCPRGCRARRGLRSAARARRRASSRGEAYDVPDSFMNRVERATRIRSSSIRGSASSAGRKRTLRNRSPASVAISSATIRPTLWRGRGVALARVPEAGDEPGHRLALAVPLGGGGPVARALALGGFAFLALDRLTLGALAFLALGRGLGLGPPRRPPPVPPRRPPRSSSVSITAGSTTASTMMSASVRNVTPGGGVRSPIRIESPMFMFVMSNSIPPARPRAGIRARLAEVMLDDPAGVDAHRLPDLVELDVDRDFSSRFTAMKSMWMKRLWIRSRWISLATDGIPRRRAAGRPARSRPPVWWRRWRRSSALTWIGVASTPAP